MQLTQAQLRGLVGITEETFRVWRNALPPLKGRKGHAQQFTLADALALLIISEFINQYGAKISRIHPLAPSLFETCETFSRAPTHDVVLVLNVQENTSSLVAIDHVGISLTTTVVVVPIGLLGDRIQKGLVPDTRQAVQLDFGFQT